MSFVANIYSGKRLPEEAVRGVAATGMSVNPIRPVFVVQQFV